MNSANNPNLNILDMDLLQQNVRKFDVQLNNLSWDEFFVLISNKKYWSLDLIQDMGSIAFDLMKSKKQLSSTLVTLKSQNTNELNLVSNQLQGTTRNVWFDDLVTATKKLIQLKENSILPSSYCASPTQWHRNGEKHERQNVFYQTKVLSNLQIFSGNPIISIQACGDAEFLKDLGFEPKNLLEICFILQYLKVHIGKIELPNPKPTTTQFFNVYEEQALIEYIEGIVKHPCTKKDIEDAINLLTCDLTSCALKDFYPDILEKPFIKIGNVYILISHLVANLQFSTNIVNAAMKKGYYTQKKTKEINKQILGEFSKQDFKGDLTDIEYKVGTLEGDIDILTYKDGYLFIIETKYTSIRFKVKQQNEYKETLQKGAKQLTKAEQYIAENFSVIKNILGLEEDNSSDLKVKTLLVSTSFEFDDYDFGHQKISLFELLGILRENRFLSGSGFLEKIAQRTHWGSLYEPNFPLKYAEALIYNHKYEQAKMLLLEVLQGNPTNHIALSNIGLCYTLLSELDNAQMYMELAISVKPDVADYFDKLGEVFTRKKDYQKALKYYQKAIELDKKFVRAYYNCGVIFHKMGDIANKNKYWQIARQLGWLFKH